MATNRCSWKGDEPRLMHRQMADVLEAGNREHSCDPANTRATERKTSERPKWPMIVLRSPKGWTGPKEVDGLKVEGFWRAHQVPIANPRGNPEHLELLDQWMRSYQPETLFDGRGRLLPELQALAPTGERRMGANPHANGGSLKRDLKLPNFRDYAVDVPQPGGVKAEATRLMGRFLRDVFRLNAEARNFRIMGPDETASNRLDAVFEVTERVWMEQHRALRCSPGSRWPRDGGLERASLPGLAGRLSAHRPTRLLLLLRGLHPHRGLHVQPACQMAEGCAACPGDARSPRSTIS